MELLREYSYIYNTMMDKINKLLQEEMDKRVDETYLPKNFEEILKKSKE